MNKDITGAEMIQEGKNASEAIRAMNEYRFTHIISSMIIDWCTHNHRDILEFLADIQIYIDGLTIWEDLDDEEEDDDNE